MIEFFFFGKPIKTLRSLGKIRVGRVTGNTHISFFWPYVGNPGIIYSCKTITPGRRQQTTYIPT